MPRGKTDCYSVGGTADYQRMNPIPYSTRSSAMRAFYCCTVCIVVIEAKKVDRLWSTSTQATKVQNVDVGRDHEREAADRRGARTRRCSAREAHQSAQRTGGDRACACALRQRYAGKKEGGS